MQGISYLLVFLLLCYSNLFSKEASIPTMVGQSLFLGIHGTKFNKELSEKIKQLRPGGIIFFGTNIRNLSQTKKLISEIKASYRAYGIPQPFIAVDQEGGNVTRIKITPRLPSPRLIGDANDFDIARNYSELNSVLLYDLGFNMNFAPVLDKGEKFASDFIGARSYATDWRSIIDNANAQIYGANYAKIISTAKHFPGHGGLKQDSHKELAVSQQSLESLLNEDIVPYRELIKIENLPAVMVGHIAFPKVDPSGLPASFSKILINDILRDKLNYKGLVITDDIQMRGAKLSNHSGIRAETALRAGVDQVMIAWDRPSQDKAFAYLVNKATKDTNFYSILKDRYDRIMATKEKYHVLDSNIPRSLSSLEFNSREWVSLFKRLMGELGVLQTHNQYLSQYETSTKDPIIVISKSKEPFNSFKLGNKERRVLYFNSRKFKNHKEIIALLDKNEDSPVYYFITSQKDFFLLNKLSSKDRNRIFGIVSTNATGFQKSLDNMVNTYTYTPEIGYFLSDKYSTISKN